MSQDNGWSRAGAQGKHRHIPPQLLKRASPRHNPNHSTQAEQAQPSKNLHGAQPSLVALPATALASIFHHLDTLDGFRLAQTCHACAAEFAHQKADFARKACKELAPTVTRASPGRPYTNGNLYGIRGDHPYGAESNPVSLFLKWRTNPGSALRRLSTLSRQPASANLVNEVWRQAWPKALWSDLLCDGLSESWPLDIAHWTSPLCIHVVIQIASDEPLRLPWNWLALNLLYAPAAGLKHYMNTSAPQLQDPELDAQQRAQEWQDMLMGIWRQDKLHIYVSLHRPAEAGHLQLVMYKTLRDGDDIWSGDEDADDTCSMDSYYSEYPTDAIHVKPSHMQKVAITGSWCRVLPKACEHVWRAHHGCHVRGLTVEDDIAVDIRDLAEPFEQSAEVLRDHPIAPSSVNILFKPFTCEIAGQSDWNLKRQQAKQREKVKRARAAGRQSKASMNGLPQASLIHQDVVLDF